MRPTAIPGFIYGSAWKDESTKDLAYRALGLGLVAVDTAGQPRHYREELVGEALRDAFRHGLCHRENVQTKFTPLEGQDHDNLPYSPGDPIEKQVRDSVVSSLHHLRTADGVESGASSYIDCVLLHSPLDTLSDTLRAWHVLEGFVPSRIRYLGISNVGRIQLDLLYDLLDIKPRIIQNRFHAGNAFDRSVRSFCSQKGIIYEAFGVFSVDQMLLQSTPVQRLARVADIGHNEALYCLIISLENTLVLNGTRNLERMKGDIQGLQRGQSWASTPEHAEEWQHIRTTFLEIVNSDTT